MAREQQSRIGEIQESLAISKEAMILTFARFVDFCQDVLLTVFGEKPSHSPSDCTALEKIRS